MATNWRDGGPEARAPWYIEEASVLREIAGVLRGIIESAGDGWGHVC